jgi:hypothetical protein
MNLDPSRVLNCEPSSRVGIDTHPIGIVATQNCQFSSEMNLAQGLSQQTEVRSDPRQPKSAQLLEATARVALPTFGCHDGSAAVRFEELRWCWRWLSLN